ncbi:MAG: GTPase HflX [Spirochaetota bacterium]|uniref:GTPase HflX n=1 Tax=Candidatus Avelusimicrobium faecicola TaxID=3416205 RepID=UPI002A62C451|nr:GTPase HflX [Spirochaetota bacterium]MDY6128485.1 GTPase HflX [Elusimicrobiaceae bacterium]
MEKVILVGASLKNAPVEEDSLAELKRLTHTAGGTVLKTVQVRLQAFNAATLIGRGKLEELALEVQAQEADTVIFDDEISPAQQNNLEEILPAKVIDRTRLILDIFAQRARTQEGKLQVELAQLKYLLPRLGGKGTALMQQKGGIGLRGPGETKLEYDKRRLRLRISKLEKEIDTVKAGRELRRQRRSQIPLPQIALVGYTNAGKSTLLNALTHTQSVYADDKLFATLDPTTRRVRMPSGGEMLFTDTVGFIQKLPHSLVTSFRATLEETAFADVILHIQDASSRKRAAQAQTVCRIITDLQAQHIPVIDVFNKADLLSPARAELLRAQNPNAVFISAANGAHLQTLLRRVEQAISYKWQVRTLTLRADQLNKIGAVYEKSLVIHQTPQADGGLQLTVMATVGNYQSLQKHLN